jgi:serine/threonine protein kinase
MSGAADRNLLLGIIALQMDFICRDDLITAMNAWVLDKATPLSRILQDQRALTESRRSLLDALVEEHIKLHDNDPKKSVAAVNATGSSLEYLSGIDDFDLLASLRRVLVKSNDVEDDPDRTATMPSAGQSTSAGTRFRILRPHAKGSLGEVFVARDTELNRDVALKEIQGRFADDRLSRARFELEAEVTGSLEHPGIVPVYGLGRTGEGRPFYAMRFIKGDSLQEVIARFYDNGAARPPAEQVRGLHRMLGHFIDICRAVDYAHRRGILHRDLKPSNVMLGKYRETLVVDWGLAMMVERQEEASAPAETTLRPTSAIGFASTDAGRAIGTPAYMSPEQAAGNLDELGPASDVYSLGAILYNILTGHTPFEGDSDIQNVLQRVKRGDFAPADRFVSAGKLAEDIDRWMTDEPLQSYLSVVTEYESLVRDHPQETKHLEQLARSRVDLGNVLHVLGRQSDAECSFRNAISDYVRLLEMAVSSSGAPSRLPLFEEGIASTYSKLGRVLMTMGRKEEAQQIFRAAYDNYKKISHTYPAAFEVHLRTQGRQLDDNRDSQDGLDSENSQHEIDKEDSQHGLDLETIDFTSTSVERDLISKAAGDWPAADVAGAIEEVQNDLLRTMLSTEESRLDLFHALTGSPEGILTLSGLRYTVLRPLAKTGLAGLFVARDELTARSRSNRFGLIEPMIPGIERGWSLRQKLPAAWSIRVLFRFTVWDFISTANHSTRCG